MGATNSSQPEAAKWGQPVETSVDRLLVEIWAEDPAQKAWLLYGQSAEDRTTVQSWLVDTSTMLTGTRCDRPARVGGQFPKPCTGCNAATLTEAQWNALPAAAGGLYAMGMEWRNHSCGGTLVVNLNEEE